MTTFRALEKAVLSKDQLAAFQSSKTFAKVTTYIEVLNNAVVGCKLTDECKQSEVRQVRLGPCCISRPFHTMRISLTGPGSVVCCVIYLHYYYLGSRWVDRGTGSRGGASEGDAAC